MMVRIGFSLLLLCSLAFGLKAQQMPIYNQYPYNPYLYNPAMAGAGGYTDMYIRYKRQWTGIEDAPDTEGDENSNLILSNKRCASVKDYIMENSDLEYSKVLTVPNGESNPMIDDRDLLYDERTDNRRVDVYILYNQN